MLRHSSSITAGKENDFLVPIEKSAPARSKENDPETGIQHRIIDGSVGLNQRRSLLERGALTGESAPKLYSDGIGQNSFVS
jgi:hypothetical protein